MYIHYKVGLFSSYQWLYRYIHCGITGLYFTHGVCGHCVGVFVCIQDVLSTHMYGIWVLEQFANLDLMFDEPVELTEGYTKL